MNPSGARFHRYVALGDSSTEGLDDPDGRGGYRGWAGRLAAKVAASNPGLLYANLAIRGRRSREILATHLAPALALRSDLVTPSSGTNDVVARRFDAADVDASHVQELLGPIGLTGFFCNGELGPVAGRNHLHGYTAALALFVDSGAPN